MSISIIFQEFMTLKQLFPTDLFCRSSLQTFQQLMHYFLTPLVNNIHLHLKYHRLRCVKKILVLNWDVSVDTPALSIPIHWMMAS